MILVDTSIWIEVFAKPQRVDLERSLDLDDVVTCLPVVQEVLQGFADQRAYSVARESMLALPRVEAPMGTEVFLEAAELYRAARRAGITPRSNVDCLIAVCALRNQLTVFHRDRDFTQLARIVPLQVLQPRG
ncbi:MAG TPA: PIN domain-containing protein [Thermoanaerobaculia bacterium]|nr:PIN domain-containing protein [Thermoanaerobaculia bacterium]